MRQGTILSYLKPKNVRLPRNESDFQNSILSSTAGIEVPEAKPEVTIDIPKLGNDEYASHEALTRASPRLSLPPDFSISSIQAHHVPKIKQMTTTLFPVRYSEKFYKECLDPAKGHVMAFVALHSDVPVGWVRCRTESSYPTALNSTTISPATNTSVDSEAKLQLYIQVIGILAPYRGQGLASALLAESIQVARARGIDSVYAHVWEESEDALLWYERNGFSKVVLQEGYYTRLKPAGAWVVVRDISTNRFL